MPRLHCLVAVLALLIGATTVPEAVAQTSAKTDFTRPHSARAAVSHITVRITDLQRPGQVGYLGTVLFTRQASPNSFRWQAQVRANKPHSWARVQNRFPYSTNGYHITPKYRGVTGRSVFVPAYRRAGKPMARTVEFRYRGAQHVETWVDGKRTWRAR